MAKGIRDGRMAEARAGPTAARTEVHTAVVVAIQRRRAVMAVRVAVITAAQAGVTTAVLAARVVATVQVLMVEEDIAKQVDSHLLDAA
jgi:tryptophan synthase beta subunit